MDTSVICHQLGYKFHQPALLRQALTHRSHSTPHNERLEFLGDSVLNCVIALKLYERFPELTEGELSRLRAGLVNQHTLFEVAQSAGLGDAVRLGEGELKSGGHRRPSILADALEALFGAVLLESGFPAAEQVIANLFGAKIAALNLKALGKDAKTQLQEYLQGRRLALPLYTVVTTRGEAHEQIFRVACEIPALKLRTEGEGNSRRAAEQNAATAALERIGNA